MVLRVFSGGAFSAELNSDYITDSVNFRVYIGSHDEYYAIMGIKEKKNKILTVGHLEKGIIASRLDEEVINS